VRDERDVFHRASVIEFGSIAARTALYERIAQRLEDTAQPIAPAGVRRLEQLLDEPPPVRDYGPRARALNGHIESILAELESAPCR